MMKLYKIFRSLIIIASVLVVLSNLFIIFGIVLHRNERHAQYQVSGGKDHTSFIQHSVTEQAAYFYLPFKRNEERKRNIREQCAVKRNETMRRKYIKVMTNNGFSFMYCRVNKAASTYAISFLKESLGYSVDLLRFYANQFRNLPPDQRKNTFNKAYTFLFVREPYGRIFSTYCNKFYFPKGNWVPIGTDIVRRYRKNPAKDSLIYGHDITFAELIRYTVEEFKAGGMMDAHIRPMHVECKPCEYNYDFIGKLETIDNDWKYIREQFGVRHITKNEQPSEKKLKRNFGELINVFRTLRMVADSNISRYSLYKRAWRYYQITGKILNRIEMPFERTGSNEIEYASFLKQLEKAANQSMVFSSELKVQKQEAMLQAYSTVPLELLEKLRNVVLEDCLLFGYDDRPKWLFDMEQKNVYNKFNYFSDLT